jgi:hypothetical protein
MKSQRFPRVIAELLDRHHRGAVTEGHCRDCSSMCCIHGGFAILENVLLIYERYTEGLLFREDYVFPEGLSLRAFVSTYFDFPLIPSGVFSAVFFHARALTKDNTLISQTRLGSDSYPAHGEPPELDRVMSKGCVFLNKKIPTWHTDDRDWSRSCILHHPESRTHLTAKPVNCVLFVCRKPFEAKHPDAKLSADWVRALFECYPNSAARVHHLMEHGASKPSSANTKGMAVSKPREEHEKEAEGFGNN